MRESRPASEAAPEPVIVFVEAGVSRSEAGPSPLLRATERKPKRKSKCRDASLEKAGNYAASLIPKHLRVKGAPKKKATQDVGTLDLFEGPAWIEARNKLVEEHLPWALDMASRVARRLPTWFLAEDMVGAAEIALLKLADQYRSYHSVPFRAFARARMAGACYDAIRRKEYRERGHAELKDQHVDASPDPEQLAQLGELTRIWAHVDKLPKRYAQVIRLIFEQGMSGDEAGEVIGVGKARVSRLKTEALAHLREMLITKGLGPT
jgi:RNA polymerase sigma-70 factor (ECF subfamily)